MSIELHNHELVVGKWYKIIRRNDSRDFWNAVARPMRLFKSNHQLIPIYYGTAFLFIEKITNKDRFELKCLYNGKICYIIDSSNIKFEEFNANWL